MRRISIRRAKLAMTIAVYIILATACFALIAGCAAVETERGKLRTAWDTYSAVGNSLVKAREAGHIDDATWEQVQMWDKRAFSALKEWRTKLNEGGETKTAREEATRAVSILNDIWLQTQSEKDDAD